MEKLSRGVTAVNQGGGKFSFSGKYLARRNYPAHDRQLETTDLHDANSDQISLLCVYARFAISRQHRAAKCRVQSTAAHVFYIGEDMKPPPSVITMEIRKNDKV